MLRQPCEGVERLWCRVGSCVAKPYRFRYGCDVVATLARLLEVASPQHGLFTVEQAATVDVGDQQVRRLAASGVVERRAQGVYRIVTVPLDEHAEMMEAILWAKGRAFIAGESALLLWDLADVNPRKIHLAVSPEYRPRRSDGRLYVVHHVRVAEDDRYEVHGVPVVSPALAIRQAIDWGIPGDMIEQAVHRAEAREHIGKQTAARLRVHLYDRASSTVTKRAANG
jgi:predicted transcriptional regulator of viral defense system